jgi:hypothetical protein
MELGRGRLGLGVLKHLGLGVLKCLGLGVIKSLHSLGLGLGLIVLRQDLGRRGLDVRVVSLEVGRSGLGVGLRVISCDASFIDLHRFDPVHGPR